MRKKSLPIGVEDYKRITGQPYYYVDKTRMIKELLDKKSMVNLFTRPRRFGKTLALSMLKTFFEQEIGVNGEILDNSRYFEGRKIMREGGEYLCHQGQYPVIALSLKAAKQPDFQTAYECVMEQVAREYKRHAYLLRTEILTRGDEEKYRAILERRGRKSDYATSLAFLSECLKSFHGKNVVVLLDEYDVPLENAYMKGFYDQMTDFIRSLFESVLKTNDCLEFAVVTGCLRVSRESIFTGLNNLKVISILDESFAEYFGFTPAEVEKMADFYGIGSRFGEMKRWYDGYLFGSTEVYNPWSVVNYVDDIISLNTQYPKSYWSNTSSNSIVRELVESADSVVKGEIEELVAGGSIEKPVHEEVTYGEVYKNQENLWNFLFFTGYLRAVSRRFLDGDIYVRFTIPNEEIRYIYRNTIQEWFAERQRGYDPAPLYEGLRMGECCKIENFINSQLSGSISYYDSAEDFYHGYLLGLLGGIRGYRIQSNKERGNGRPDLLLEPDNPRDPAVVMEVKRVRKFSQMEAACDRALRQIQERNYASGLLDEGCCGVLEYGICFCRKSCMVKVAKRDAA